jgi:glycosyltransferase involved in cell wall biosynthesis
VTVHRSATDQNGKPARWQTGTVPVAVVMISLNEAHNLEDVLRNLAGWAQQVFLVDSCSADETVDIALRHGVQVVQRRFKGFGDQWNFAVNDLPITAPWTMKLDPDERLTDELKASIEQLVRDGRQDGIIVQRRLWFMGALLPVEQAILRVWRTRACRFTDVAVNEYPIVEGCMTRATGYLEHHDSPDLDHWLAKQNRYTTAEAIAQFEAGIPAAPPRLFGSALQRRMWLKRHFWRVPGRYVLLFLYHLLVTGAWRVGRVGWIWARLRTEVYRMWEYKRYEMVRLGHVPAKIPCCPGTPHPQVRQYQ